MHPRQKGSLCPRARASASAARAGAAGVRDRRGGREALGCGAGRAGEAGGGEEAREEEEAAVAAPFASDNASAAAADDARTVLHQHESQPPPIPIPVPVPAPCRRRRRLLARRRRSLDDSLEGFGDGRGGREGEALREGRGEELRLDDDDGGGGS